MESLGVATRIVPVPSYTAVTGPSGSARHGAERRRLEADREQLLEIALRAVAEAQAASRFKDEFLAMLGHELRNSLSAVRNAVACVRLDSRQSERALDIAWRQTEQLDRLVEDLLDVTQIAQGCFRLNRQRVALMEIVEHAVEAMRFLVEDRGHTLSVSPPLELVCVDGDPLRLEQIVLNLVSNAAKYTDRGGRIELLVERHGAEAVIRVRDSGIGIKPELLQSVFEAFIQGDRVPGSLHDALGLGLTLAHRFCELLGGSIAVESAPSKGTRVALLLPLAVPPSAVLITAAAVPS